VSWQTLHVCLHRFPDAPHAESRGIAGPVAPRITTLNAPAVPVGLDRPRFARSGVFASLTAALLRQRTPTAEGPKVQVPVLYGGMGTGKTRTAWEAALAFVRRDYIALTRASFVRNEELIAQDVYDVLPQRRVAAYLRLPVSRPATEASAAAAAGAAEAAAGNVAYEGSLALAVALAEAFGVPREGQSPLYSSGEPHVIMKRALLEEGISCVALVVDEFQTDLNFAARVVRGASSLTNKTDFKVVLILSGLRPLRGTLELQGSQWNLHEERLAPFDVAAEDVSSAEFRASFLEAIRMPLGDYQASRPIQVLYQDCGGFPRHTNALIESLSRRLRGAQEWPLNYLTFQEVYDEVTAEVSKFTSPSRWSSAALPTDVAKGVALAVLVEAEVSPSDIVRDLRGEAPTPVGNADASECTFQVVVDSGICAAQERGGKLILLLPTFGVLALAMRLKERGVFVLPDDASVRNPFADNVNGFEAMTMAGMYARLEWAGFRGKALMDLRELRPGAVVLPESPSWTILVRVPRQLKWCGRTDDVSRLVAGQMCRTQSRTTGLDGGVVLEGSLKLEDGAAGSASGAAPRAGVTTRAARAQVEAAPKVAAAAPAAGAPAAAAAGAGLVLVGVQSKSADAELAAERRITSLEPGLIRTDVIPRAAVHFARFREVQSRRGALSWSVLDVVSDRLGAAHGYASVTSDADHYGIAAVLVTTRETVNESLGRVVASRKRMRGD